MVSCDRVHPGRQPGIASKAEPVPVGFEENFLRKVERAAAVSRDAETPGGHARMVAAENFGEEILIFDSLGIAQYEHHFLIRQSFRAGICHAPELCLECGLSSHATMV
jgi:hypothetical protein